ncbi:hypothetical protein [Bradyrhizobium sp. 199]|uniref:hypothetical protein n=1 Tax=Bradyrhizobium sp. 199 TaxID=2782664 RepID=UPI001FF734B2|nr:hypothetical protein [Bradyrhizobium sp. 199]MCK1357659.1 hypothetical protein [Bradyrhizobium sp. 199]
MDIKAAKAAILVRSGKSLIGDEFTLPDALEHGQVLAHVHISSICGAQINEIDAVKGVDKFLPRLLGTKRWQRSSRPDQGGQCQPARDIPRLVRLSDTGEVSYRGIVTHEFALDDVNDALDLMRCGTSAPILLNIS